MSEKRKMQISELMVVVRKYTQPSAGIDNFETLLNELGDDTFVDVIISDMNKFIQEFSVLNRDVDEISNVVLKSKLLTYDFIQPKQFFRRSYKEMTKEIVWLKSLNHAFGKDTLFCNGARNILGLIPVEKIMSDNGVRLEALSHEQLQKEDELYERSRRVFLLWNYTPAIVKAMIMTKRRALGLDNNSKKFK